jgi:hypothetical protein
MINDNSFPVFQHVENDNDDLDTDEDDEDDDDLVFSQTVTCQPNPLASFSHVYSSAETPCTLETPSSPLNT